MAWQELFSTDIGLMSVFTIAFIIGMAVYLYRFAKRHIAEDEKQAAELAMKAGVDIDMMKRKFIDVQVIYHKLEQRTLSAAYKFYCQKKF